MVQLPAAGTQHITTWAVLRGVQEAGIALSKDDVLSEATPEVVGAHHDHMVRPLYLSPRSIMSSRPDSSEVYVTWLHRSSQAVLSPAALVSSVDQSRAGDAA